MNLFVGVWLQFILREGTVLEVEESLLLEETPRPLVGNNHTASKRVASNLRK